MSNNGTNIGGFHQKIINKINSCLEKTQQEETAAVNVIKDRLAEKTKSIISELEYQVDLFVGNNCETKFNPYNYYMANEIKETTANDIVRYYEPLLLELGEAIEGSCPQLKEAYRIYSKKERPYTFEKYY